MTQRFKADLFGWVINVAGVAACLYSALNLPVAQLDLGYLVMALVISTCSSHLIVRIPRLKGEITVSDTFIFLTMLIYGGEAAVLLAAADGTAASVRISKRLTSFVFNPAVMACATFATVWALRLSFGSSIVEVTRSHYSARFIVLSCAMALVQYVVNAGLAAIRSALLTGQTIIYTWTNGFLWTSITYFAGAFAAGIVAKLIGVFSVFAFLATVPIIAIVYFTYRTYLKSVEASQAQAEQAEKHVAELSHHLKEQERISRALKESEEQFRKAFDHAAGMALVSTDGHWLQVNQSLCDMLGYAEAEMLASNFQQITHPEDLGHDLTEMYQLVEGKLSTSQSEKRYTHREGRDLWVLQSVSLVRDAEGRAQHFIFQIQDITERKQAEEKIHHAAFHDALTGLPNRILLSDRLSLAVERAKRHRDYQFAVLFIDLDRFKIVNDSLGHQYGDMLLIQVSERLRRSVRAVDTVARLGGDEFAILLDGVEGVENAAPTAARIQEHLTTPFDLDGQEVFISGSIGIAFSTAGYDKPEDILRDSDTAMYRAKANGKARHEIFDQAMHTRAMELLQLENDLRHAVERREFEVYYQAIVECASGRVSGFEALVRWQHPLRGTVSPADFIPLAEETGLIIPLGLEVLRQACAQTARWQREFAAEKPLTISVNLSPKQLKQPDLVEQIRDILEESGLPPRSLRLELTESLVMENAEFAAQVMRRLKLIGLQLSLDDFGTGYSSLSHLHRFPFDILKIDKSFVMRLGEDRGSEKIVKTILMLASELDMAAVAEGVETEEQAAHLRALDCDYGQGYLFSKPLPAQSAETLLQPGTPLATPAEAEEAFILEEVKTLSSNYSM
jgi:diguanylate cyclase (GGDEF)-like protein/PAS domain S-box-containing protein